MYFEKIFEYGHDWEVVLSFIAWWIRSENFTRDIKEGDIVDDSGSRAVRSIEHTVRVIKRESNEIIIEKGAIMSDCKRNFLRDGEYYLNKVVDDKTGLDRTIEEVEKWLRKVSQAGPTRINFKKAVTEGMLFDSIGVGLFVENSNFSVECPTEWALSIRADVVRLPQ